MEADLRWAWECDPVVILESKGTGRSDKRTQSVANIRREAILKRREEQKRVTLEERSRYNRSRSMTTNLGELSPEP